MSNTVSVTGALQNFVDPATTTIGPVTGQTIATQWGVDVDTDVDDLKAAVLSLSQQLAAAKNLSFNIVGLTTQAGLNTPGSILGTSQTVTLGGQPLLVNCGSEVVICNGGGGSLIQYADPFPNEVLYRLITPGDYNIPGLIVNPIGAQTELYGQGVICYQQLGTQLVGAAGALVRLDFLAVGW